LRGDGTSASSPGLQRVAAWLRVRVSAVIVSAPVVSVGWARGQIQDHLENLCRFSLSDLGSVDVGACVLMSFIIRRRNQNANTINRSSPPDP